MKCVKSKKSKIKSNNKDARMTSTLSLFLTQSLTLHILMYLLLGHISHLARRE